MPERHAARRAVSARRGCLSGIAQWRLRSASRRSHQPATKKPTEFGWLFPWITCLNLRVVERAMETEHRTQPID